VEILGCDFTQNAANENFLICIDDGGANTCDLLRIEGCTFIGYDTSNTFAISLGAAQDRVVIKDNLIIGFFETTAIGGAGVITNCLIENNYIKNIDTDADQCILLGANSTGIIARNIVGAALAAGATTNISVGTLCVLGENYSSDLGDVQGVLDPVAT
jgi:hypothetical protein